MKNKTDCARKCQQLEVLIDLLERENKRLRELIVYCKGCKYAEYIDDVKTLWCTECGQGRTVAPYDFCSYGERSDA